VLRAAKGLAWMATGAALLPLGCLRGRHEMVAALRRVWTGAGNLAALAGVRYQEYGR